MLVHMFVPRTVHASVPLFTEFTAVHTTVKRRKISVYRCSQSSQEVHTTSSLVLCAFSRSPRWTSGSPRMLLVLIREFECRRGEILNLFAQIKKDQLLRAPSVGKHNSTRVDEGRKS